METRFSEPPGFDNLSKAEQILYVTALWDRIADGPGDLPGEPRRREARNLLRLWLRGHDDRDAHPLPGGPRRQQR